VAKAGHREEAGRQETRVLIRLPMPLARSREPKFLALLVSASGLLLMGPRSLLASGEYVMVYPISALAAIGLSIWITKHLVRKLWARIVSLAVVLGTIYGSWEYVGPSPKSLLENFGWWILLLTAIPVLTGTCAAVVLRLFTRTPSPTP
jgi:hypothetical protein